jgi:hypothetical protein
LISTFIKIILHYEYGIASASPDVISGLQASSVSRGDGGKPIADSCVPIELARSYAKGWELKAVIAEEFGS